MNRSTACFFGSSATGAPAWLVDVNALPSSVQAAWLAGILTLALVGGYFWAFDGK